MTAQGETFERYVAEQRRLSSPRMASAVDFDAGWLAALSAAEEAIKARLTDGEMFREIKMGELFRVVRELKETE